ncbi:hypothetical protein C8J57DRAFT_1214678 [Mycena rebaudengoi]|nr:hypothetical protein C8J57DRAFT_1214678 [Mycena rebaudengoi]
MYSTSSSEDCLSPPPSSFERKPCGLPVILSGLVEDLTDGQPWFSTAIPWRRDVDRDPDTRHLIRHCENILSKDRRRRFTFGITVDIAEDDDITQVDPTELRIWFFSRTHDRVSEPLNVVADTDILIRLLLSIAFATPEQLGYDSSMVSFLDGGGKVQYKLTLDDTVYVTKKLLSDNRSDTVCDAVQESTQLLELHDRLRTLKDPGTPHSPADFFLTVLAHGFVKTVDGADDDMVGIMMRGQILPVESANHPPRKHYRVVFKELGTPVDRLST